MTDDADELFTVPPADFVAARDQLAKHLKSEGRVEESKEVKARRRPAVSVWALNCLARQRPGELEQLVAAGAAVRNAGSGAELRETTERLQASIHGLVRAAADAISEAHATGAPPLREIEAALRAAAADPAAAELVASGRLTEMPPWEEMSMWSVAAGRKAEDPAAAKPSTKPTAEIRGLERDLAAAKAEVERAAEAVEGLQRQLEGELDRLGLARSRLSQVEATLREARDAG